MKVLTDKKIKKTDLEKKTIKGKETYVSKTRVNLK